MRLPVALFALALGAVEVAGAMQELFYGITQSVTDAVSAGALGAVSGAIVVIAGIALLTRSRRAPELALASAYISIPVFLLIGLVKHFAAWPITLVGMIFPILLAVFCRRGASGQQSTPHDATAARDQS
jgi:Ca2+/Na+ antiporter